MRIGIAGITGRMGRLLAEEVLRAGETLTGGIASDRDSPHPLFETIEALAAASDLVIDFTHASAVTLHARVLVKAGVSWVLGTTGYDAGGQAAIEAAAAHVPVIAAANYAPGVNLVMVLAERIAAALPAEDYDAEILEMHHRQKVDAPSGTALAIGRAVAEGRGQEFQAAAALDRTGARVPGTIGFAALRGGQVVGDHTLIFASGTETITLRHEAWDRRVFARGAVRAARWLGGQKPGLYSMRNVLGL